MIPALDLSLPQGSLVLVTGSNGFIASHVADQLLQLGYRVRGTIRAEKKWLDDHFQGKYGPDSYHSVIVPAIEADGAFQEAMKGVSGVVHVASDMSRSPIPEVVINTSVAGTQNALEAARETNTVRRFVLTSSSTAAHSTGPNDSSVVVDKDSWNMASIEAAWNPDTPNERKAGIVYAASKTQQELDAWKWYDSRKPNFALNTILPNVNIGPTVTKEIPGSTTALIRSLLDGNSAPIHALKSQYFIDVRDTARLHVAALLDPDVKSERVFAFAHALNWHDIIPVLREMRPSNTKIPDPPVNEGRNFAEIRPRKRAMELLQRNFDQPNWLSVKESLAASIEGV